MHNSRIKRISLAVCLAMMPFAAEAAGLGKLTVFSGLGEPLSAEIELSASSEELNSLTARIAPAETYTEQGLERPATLAALRVELGKQDNGTPVIKLTSAQPVNDPFLDMLIQMEWSSGRLLREYTALLDPPGYGEQKSAETVAPPVAAPAAAATAATNAVQKSGKTHKVVTPATRQSAQAEPAIHGEGYTTRSGDTLHGVASQMQAEGVSLDQMLVGIYRANKDAFIDQNMNRLKVGKILRAPDSEELKSLSQQEALKEIRVHTANWHAYRNKLAGAVAESAPQSEGTQGRSASGKITASAVDKAAAPVVGPRDVVKLSKSDAAMSKPGSAETPTSQQDQLKAAKEDATARDKASKEADARLALLEKQLQDAQKLLQLKNQTLADLQKEAAAGKPQPVALLVPAPEVKKPIPEPAVAEVKPAEAPVAAAPKPEAPTKARKPRRTPPVVEPEPAPEPSLLNDPVMMGALGGGLLVLLGGGWLYLRNKRRKGLDSFEQGILTTSGLKPNTVFGNTAGGMVDTGDTSFLTDLSQGSGGMIDTNDVDPIAEAEVYMAYGRDVQAEEILKDAIVKEPRRYELHQKLLEIYANRKDTTAFETLAGELYATLGATDPNWQKFAAMGRALEPENPLYSAEVQSAATVRNRFSATQEFSSAVLDVPEQDDSRLMDEGAETFLNDEQDTTLSFTGSPAAQDNGLDFDLDLDHDFDLDLTGDEERLEAPAQSGASEVLPELDLESADEVPHVSAGVEEINDAGLDFSFDLPEPASAENVQLGIEDIGLEPEPVAESQAQDAVTLEPLPEQPAEVTASFAASESALEDISFDLPEFEFEVPEVSGAVVAEAAEPVHATPDLPEAEPEPEPEAELESIPELEPEPEPEPEPKPESEQAKAVAADTVATVAEVAPLEMPDLNFDLPAAAANAQVPADAPLTDILGGNVHEMDALWLSPVQDVESASEEIVFDAVAEEEGALDFDFDVEMDETAAMTPQHVAALGLPDLNLSGISLDLDEPVAAPAASPVEAGIVDFPEEPVMSRSPAASLAAADMAEATLASDAAGEELTFAANESADVDTKLDLVTAYMDMGDTEGARELLQEVMSEGGPQQRDRAQGILDRLG